jgi:hypothetical protein
LEEGEPPSGVLSDAASVDPGNLRDIFYSVSPFIGFTGVSDYNQEFEQRGNVRSRSYKENSGRVMTCF